MFLAIKWVIWGLFVHDCSWRKVEEKTRPINRGYCLYPCKAVFLSELVLYKVQALPASQREKPREHQTTPQSLLHQFWILFPASLVRGPAWSGPNLLDWRGRRCWHFENKRNKWSGMLGRKTGKAGVLTMLSHHIYPRHWSARRPGRFSFHSGRPRRSRQPTRKREWSRW